MELSRVAGVPGPEDAGAVGAGDGKREDGETSVSERE